MVDEPGRDSTGTDEVEKSSKRRIGMKTRLAIILAFCFLLSPSAFASESGGIALKAIESRNDTAELLTLVKQIAQAVRLGRHSLSLKEKVQNAVVSSESFSIEVDSIRLITKTLAHVIVRARDFEDFDEKDLLVLEKKGGSWRLADSSRFSDISVGLPRRENQRNSSEPASFSSVVGTILIPEVHPGIEEDIYVIHRTLINQHYGVDLYGPSAVLALDAMTSLNQPEIGFSGDNVWQRIIFGSPRNGAPFLYSYGDNPGDKRFARISGLVSDPFDTLFVCDEARAYIVKLYYNRSSYTLNFISEFRVGGLYMPNDIAYDQGFSVCDPNDDGIWVADYLHGQLVMINRAGSVVKTITHYVHNGTTYPLRPAKVASSRFRPLGVTGPYIGVINRQRAYWPYQDFFVTLDAGSMSGTTAHAVRSTEYRTGDYPPHYLVSLGIDIFGSNPAGSPVSISRRSLAQGGDFFLRAENFS
jgi:hypothetical protein